MKVLVTRHAAQRYQDRVKWYLTEKQASFELQALVDAADIKTGEELGEEELRQTQKYVVLSDGIYAPLEVDQYGDYFITSILIRGGMSTKSRKYRNEKRRARHYARAKARKRGGRQPYRRDTDFSN